MKSLSNPMQEDKEKKGILTRIYGIFILLIEFNGIETVIFGLMKLVELFQTLYLPIYILLSASSKSNSTIFGIIEAADFSYLIHRYSDFWTFSIMYMVILSLLSLLVVCIIIMGRFKTHERHRSLGHRILLTGTSALFTSLSTWMLIPALQILATPLLCSGQTNLFYPSLKCLIILMFLCLSFLLCFCHSFLSFSFFFLFF